MFYGIKLMLYNGEIIAMEDIKIELASHIRRTRNKLNISHHIPNKSLRYLWQGFCVTGIM